MNRIRNFFKIEKIASTVYSAARTTKSKSPLKPPFVSTTSTNSRGSKMRSVRLRCAPRKKSCVVKNGLSGGVSWFLLLLHLAEIELRIVLFGALRTDAVAEHRI